MSIDKSPRAREKAQTFIRVHYRNCTHPIIAYFKKFFFLLKKYKFHLN